MSDLTPDLIALPGSTSPEDYYRDAVAAIREGAKRWKDAKANFRAEVGRFFYAAALNLDDKRYKELVKVAVEAFDIGSDSIARYRLEWQRSKSLPAPTPKSASQQRRSIEGATSARPRAGSETSGDRPPERGPGAGGGSAAPSSSGRTQDVAEEVHADGCSPHGSAEGDGRGEGSRLPRGLDQASVPNSAAPSSAAPTPETTDESGDEGNPPPSPTSAPKPVVSGSSRPAGLREALNVQENRPAGPSVDEVDRLLARLCEASDAVLTNANAFLKAKAIQKLSGGKVTANGSKVTMSTNDPPPGSGSLVRREVEPSFKGKR